MKILEDLEDHMASRRIKNHELSLVENHVSGGECFPNGTPHTNMCKKNICAISKFSNGKYQWERKWHNSQNKLLGILLTSCHLCKCRCERSFHGGHENVCRGCRRTSLAAFEEGKPLVDADFVSVPKRIIQFAGVVFES